MGEEQMIVGIDLGTTNSAIGIWRDGASLLIPNHLGDLLTPSAVSLSGSGELLVGLAARERQSTHPELTATAFKRLMGTQQKLQLGRSTFTAEDLSALVLRSLKADAEAWLDEPVERAVITVPAYFNDRQRKATRRAGELAGFTVERLVNEPTAAALAYGIHQLEEEQPFLVFDLGGGTFDVSIVEIFDGIIEVRASAGDNRLGGEDFNDVLVEMARERLDPEGIVAGGRSSQFRELLRAAAERARRALGDNSSATLQIVWEDQAHQVEIDAAEFERRAEPLIARLREPVLRSLRDSNIRVDRLSEVLLVGGATRMPIVRRAVTRMFGRFPSTRLDPDQAVALGAAVKAGLKSRDAALEEVRLTDVCPFTLGIAVSEREAGGGLRDDVFSPIIERNTVVPASRVQTYSTMHSGQRQVNLAIYQGEARSVTANVRLGEIKVPVPAAPAGSIAIDCRFSYDASGLLEVDVTVPATGLTHQLVICDDEDAPSDAELAERRKRLAALKVHPRDDAANSAALARAERCYEMFLGERRDFVGSLISGFRDVVDKQEPRAIETARREMEATLDELEGERFL
jgi:molecular chaperone HscC